MQRHIYDETHEMFRKTVRGFMDRHVRPNFYQWEQEGIVDRDLYRRAGEAGLLGFAAPEQFGGGGNPDFRFNAVMIEEFCRDGMSNAVQGIILHTCVVMPYFLYLATEEQKERWLPGLISGDLVSAIAMTEPGTGSDLAAVATRARLQDGRYRISGAKQFISNGEHADLIIVVCRTDGDGPAHKNLSLIVVEGETPGLVRGPQMSKIGQHSTDTTQLFFDEAQVPAENLLGEGGRGFYHLMLNLPSERLSIAITALAHAEAAFSWALLYAKERHAFGQAIGSFQHNRIELATLRTELDIAWVFIDRQLEALPCGEVTPEDAAEAKWWCTELNKRVLDRALQLHGGNGYMEEFPVARAWRDGRVMTIYGGTTEIMKDMIGKRVLGL